MRYANSSLKKGWYVYILSDKIDTPARSINKDKEFIMIERSKHWKAETVLIPTRLITWC